MGGEEDMNHGGVGEGDITKNYDIKFWKNQKNEDKIPKYNLHILSNVYFMNDQ